jgi:hypothetical protein
MPVMPLVTPPLAAATAVMIAGRAGTTPLLATTAAGHASATQGPAARSRRSSGMEAVPPGAWTNHRAAATIGQQRADTTGWRLPKTMSAQKRTERESVQHCS